VLQLVVAKESHFEDGDDGGGGDDDDDNNFSFSSHLFAC
jgi:hypothetical protein